MSEELLPKRKEILRTPRTRPIRIPPNPTPEGMGLQRGAVQHSPLPGFIYLHPLLIDLHGYLKTTQGVF